MCFCLEALPGRELSSGLWRACCSFWLSLWCWRYASFGSSGSPKVQGSQGAALLELASPGESWWRRPREGGEGRATAEGPSCPEAGLEWASENRPRSTRTDLYSPFFFLSEKLKEQVEKDKGEQEERRAFHPHLQLTEVGALGQEDK